MNTRDSTHTRIAAAVDQIWPGATLDALDAVHGGGSSRAFVRVRLTPARADGGDGSASGPGDASDGSASGPGDASDGSASGPGGAPDSCMAMVLARDAARDEEIGARVERAPETLPWLVVQRDLSAWGVRVPRVFGFDEARGVLLHEDLGPQTIEAWLEDGTTPRGDVYAACIELLARFQTATREVDEGFLGAQRRFDAALLWGELWHYVEYGVEARFDCTLSEDERRQLEACFAPLVDALLTTPFTTAHRDFQSRNIMHLGGGDLALIDFQDVLQAPFVYDLVALLRDSYVALSVGEVDEALGRYLPTAQALGFIETAADLERAFALQTIQRKLKDTGRFVFFERVKGLEGFADYLDRNLGYVAGALRRLDAAWVAPLVARLQAHDPAFARQWREGAAAAEAS